MRRRCIFFDLGQTLVNEWPFINYCDNKILELLNGFGERIDIKNYHAIRNNIIRNRNIGLGSLTDLVREVCRLICPIGYDTLILRRFEAEIINEGHLFQFFDDTVQTIEILSNSCDLGIISNQTENVQRLFDQSEIKQYFKFNSISSDIKLKKPDPRIFMHAMSMINRVSEDCIMVGDRLDTDIRPANKLGIKTIRTTNSLFNLQKPIDKFEIPSHTISSLAEIPKVLNII